MHATMTQQALQSLSVPDAAREAGAASGAPLTLLRLRAQWPWQGATVAYSAMDGRWSVLRSSFFSPSLDARLPRRSSRWRGLLQHGA